jgi:hypothetical protein
VSRLDEPNIDGRAQAERGVDLWPEPQLWADAIPRRVVDIEGVEKRPAIAFVWERFSPDHVARGAACAAELADRFEVYGLELATHELPRADERIGLKKVTLFPGEGLCEIGALRGARRIVGSCLRIGARHVFLGNYESPAIVLAAAMLRLLGRRVIVMQEARGDEHRRRLGSELWNSVRYLPCRAALAAGQMTQADLRFLGFSGDRVFVGCDTVSVGRVRRIAGVEPAPRGVPHAQRHFTVIAPACDQYVLDLVLEAYAASCAERAGGKPIRPLHIVGAGEFEQALRSNLAALRLEHVHFLNRPDDAEMARILSTTLALVLPRIERRHGLIVNQAIAMGVPVLLSDNWGARDLLVRSGVNGYVFEADNVVGLAHFLALLDRDAAEWVRLSLGSRHFLAVADTPHFVRAVAAALDT